MLNRPRSGGHLTIQACSGTSDGQLRHSAHSGTPPSRIQGFPMKRRLPFRYILPAFFGGLLDDPLLFLRIRPLKRALLFDCGQIAHLAKRVVKPIDTVFITHAHMDHIMGIPTLIRHHHISPRPLDIFGPPGIAERVYHLLMGYDWNLSEPDWSTVCVHEVLPNRLLHYSFIGPERFA